MVHMINALMGNDMYVAEERVEEYLAAGHTLAAVPADKKKEEKTPVRKSSRKQKG